jgi:O-antigen ligase/polysaccharide polymerase Wzy-like membrane protein
MIALLQDFWLFAWCLCLVNVCRTPRALAVVLHTWIWSAAAWAIVLLIGEFTGNAYLAGIQSWEGGRTSLTFGDPNYSAYYFFIAMMMIAATRYPRRRRTRVLMYALLLPPWALSGSNGAVVELLLAIYLIVVIAVHREFGPTLAISAGCFLLAFTAVAVPRVPFARIQRAAHDSQYRLLRDWLGRSEKTFDQRKELDHESIDLFLAGGPLGEGPTSTIHRLTVTQAPFAREAHNDYLAALTERGFIGAAGLLLLLGSVLTRAGSLVRGRFSTAFAEVVPRAGPLVAAVAGTFVFSTVYEVLHARDVWALFAVVAALSLWGRD